MKLPTLSNSARARWPLALLLASIGLTALAAVQAQRALQSKRSLAETALKEMASLAAWTYQQHLRDTLSIVAREALGAVNHGDTRHTNPRIPDAGELLHYLRYDTTCECHRPQFGPSPRLFFGFKLGTDTLAVATNGSGDEAIGWRATPRDPTATHMQEMQMRRMPGPDAPHIAAGPYKWIADTLTRNIRGGATHPSGYGLVVSPNDAKSRALFYTLMITGWGDTLVYGASYDATEFAGLLASVLDGNGLLPSSFTYGSRNRDVLAVRVSTSGDLQLFAPSNVQQWKLSAEHRLPPEYGGLVVRAQIHASRVKSEAFLGAPTSRAPFLFGLLILAAALSVVAVTQIRREGELASMRGAFVSGVSHELRTPLAQIRLYLDTLRLGRAQSEDQRRWTLDNVERETTRLSQLVERVLRFSRVGHDDAGHPSPVHIGEEVARIVEEFAPLAQSARATITTTIDEVPTVALRPDALRQILVNLLDNAVKFGPAGQIVSVHVAPLGALVRIEVSDQGPGVPVKERERVWTEFARGQAASHVAGSGLGLPIVKDVVTRHGGTVAIESTERGGARFIVDLPAMQSDAPSPVAANGEYATTTNG